MDKTSRWKTRIANSCVFIEDGAVRWPILQHTSRPGIRPYIHPLRIGDGTVCLTEDSPWHHPWQHGIATGYHGVNGCDFWFDPGQMSGFVIGTIEPSTPRILGEDPPTWEIDAMWRHEDGSPLLFEQQTWQLSDGGSVLWLDIDWSIQALTDVAIEQGKYGGLFIRMPFRKQWGGTVVNSNGLKDKDAEQQSAEWVDVTMPIENSDDVAGMMLLDHPSNPQHPAHWRVDNQAGINPAPCIPGEIKLAAGDIQRHRYRMVLHSGVLSAEKMNQQWTIYAEGQ